MNDLSLDQMSSNQSDEKDPMVWDPPPPKQQIQRGKQAIQRRLMSPRDSGAENDNVFKVYGKNSKPSLSDRVSICFADFKYDTQIRVF